jgi:2-keto-4-pentenoate hydratase
MNDISRTILNALDLHQQIDPLSDTRKDLDLASAYRIADSILASRRARGEHPIGWKIGFTNRTIWDEYDVHAPIWGPVYDTTVQYCLPDGPTAEIDLDRLVEARIEPEIVLRVAKIPHPAMDDRELFGCLDGLAHGFEIVQSIYPAWRFRATDTVAAFALHGALVHGPLVAIDHTSADRWIETLATFEIDLSRDGEVVDHGRAENVLGSPLSAFRHFVAGMRAMPLARGIEAGDLISTGTLTRAFPIEAGEIWSTRLSGLDLPGMRLRISGGPATVERLILQAIKARFHVETPASCHDTDAYERAVAEDLAAETALSRLLYSDQGRLADVRKRIESQATVLAQEWNSKPAS